MNSTQYFNLTLPRRQHMRVLINRQASWLIAITLEAFAIHPVNTYAITAVLITMKHWMLKKMNEGLKPLL